MTASLFPLSRHVDHTCHALTCDVPVPPKMLMCKRHWSMVPKHLRDRVWATYQIGQERRDGGPLPSEAWHHAADAAICAVACKEGRPHKCVARRSR
jgi:hypothetical protein